MFILGSTLKDICSRKSVLGHPSRGDDSVSTKKKYTVEVLLAKIWYQKQCFSCSASQSFPFPESQREAFPKTCEVSLFNKWCVRGYSAKASCPYCWATWLSSILPCITKGKACLLFLILTFFPSSSPSLSPSLSLSLSPSRSSPVYAFFTLVTLPYPLSLQRNPWNNGPMSIFMCYVSSGDIFRSVWWDIYAEVQHSGSAFLFSIVCYHFFGKRRSSMGSLIFFFNLHQFNLL